MAGEVGFAVGALLKGKGLWRGVEGAGEDLAQAGMGYREMGAVLRVAELGGAGLLGCGEKRQKRQERTGDGGWLVKVDDPKMDDG